MSKAEKTGDECLSYVKGVLNGFLNDHPDSDYQRGYLAATFEIKKFLDGKISA